MLRILLIDHSVDPNQLLTHDLRGYQQILCLFWAAPETLQKLEEHSAATVFDLRGVVGNTVEWQRRAYEMTASVCSAGPCYRGLPWRSYLIEPLYREALVWQVALDVHHLIEQWCATESGQIQMDSALSPTLATSLRMAFENEPLPQVVHQPNPIPINASSTANQSRLSFWLHLAREAQLTGRWRAYAWSVLNALDKSFLLRRVMSFFQPHKIQPGGITFFSSYLNNSRNLRAFEAVMSGPVNWVFTNYYARQGALPSQAPMGWLWQSAPSDNNGSMADDFAFESSALPGIQPVVLRKLVSQSHLWQSWQSGELSVIARMTGFWESYLERAQPRLIVMANHWGIEGWFAQIAELYGIPVLDLMHGLFGGYLYTQTPIHTDGSVVYGEFWRQLLSQQVQPRVVVYNPAQHFESIPRHPSGVPRLTFFSMPLSKVLFYNAAELVDGINRTLHKIARDGNCQIHVRAHPLENPVDLIGHWRRLYGSVPANVHFGKHEPLRQILAETDVALMFRSTVMLNCLVSGIPIVMPGWIDFDWNRSLERIPGIHLATNFTDMERCVRDWLTVPPDMGQDVSRQFVRAAGEGQTEWSNLLSQVLPGIR